MVENFIMIAMQEAEIAITEGNPPFGAVITDKDGNIIAKAHNTQNTTNDPTAHGEINALRIAGQKLQTRNFTGCKVFINTEPCSMCMSALVKANISEVYFGAPQENGNNPDIHADEIAAKCSYPITVKGGFLITETAKQVVRGRETLKTSKKK